MEILQELHVSIAAACEASFGNAYRKMESQLTTRETGIREVEQNSSVASAGRQAAECKIQELQHEVSTLQEELRRYEASPKELELPTEFANLEDEFAPKHIWGPHPHNADQLQEILENKYTALYTNLQTFVRSWSSLKAKVLQHKKKLRHWDKQLERDEFTLLVHGAPVAFRRVQCTVPGNTENTVSSTMPALGDRPRSERDTMQGLGVAAKIVPSVLSLDRPADANPNIKMEENSQSMNIANLPESTPTQSSGMRRDPITSESSSDVLHPLPDVHARKRKRVVPSSHTQPGGSIGRAELVKNEAMSSSPMQCSNHSLVQPLPSTQDLDEIGDTVQTPTKRNTRWELHWEESASGNEVNWACTQQVRTDRPFQQPSVLQPVDGNVRMAKYSSQGSVMKRMRRTDQRAMLSIAEDGDAGERDIHPGKPYAGGTSIGHTEPSRSKADAKPTQHRLQGLLEGSLPSRSPLGFATDVHGLDTARNSNENAALRRDSRAVEPTSSQVRLLQSDKSATQWGSQNCPEVHLEEEPYRSLPLHRLNLEHFKINPARNQGLDYAYDAVVRNKDDRKCISGCTRPGCCGDRFRAMARLGGLPANALAEQTKEDQRILEEYVGEDRHLLNGLSAQGRETLLMEARARVLANLYGRHRHNHQRARTPPGFWRTEMPDTQEVETDREAAQRQEREKVEQRYREAMRPGGLWTWADE